MTAAIAILVQTGCDGENPVEPIEPKDYVVWCEDYSGSGKYYGHHVATGRIDSFFVPFHASYRLYVSADGERLYAHNDEGIGVIDIESESLVEVIPDDEYVATHGLVFSPDGRYVAIQGAELDILTYPDHAPVYHDTSEVRLGYFTRDGRRFYCIGEDSAPRLVDMTNLTMEIQETLSYLITDFLPTADETKWLLIERFSHNAGQFLVYDPQTDSVLFKEVAMPALGPVVRTPDDRFAFYSVPGTILSDIPGQREFRVFDIAANRLDRLISTVGIADGIHPENMVPGYMYVTPDGRFLFVAAPFGEGVLVLDIHAMKIVRYYEPQGELRWVLFAAQSGL